MLYCSAPKGVDKQVANGIFDKSLRATTWAVRLGDANGGRGYRISQYFMKILILEYHSWDIYFRVAFLCHAFRYRASIVPDTTDLDHIEVGGSSR